MDAKEKEEYAKLSREERRRQNEEAVRRGADIAYSALKVDFTTYLDSQRGEDYLDSQRREDYLDSQRGEGYLDSQRGEDYLDSQRGEDNWRSMLETDILQYLIGIDNIKDATAEITSINNDQNFAGDKKTALEAPLAKAYESIRVVKGSTGKIRESTSESRDLFTQMEEAKKAWEVQLERLNALKRAAEIRIGPGTEFDVESLKFQTPF
ncbi:hypothetical protein DM02DRAFT_696124 [Periconia macrospinosa]|uniref:Uncharacterized protein n=1 Tax=Periconia macrospinosa TaxID=97972 RepID=A0A2V1D5Q5_9PLEO|nr:hypothetical protein DM02DRAFT_696124 [Periconia macrospinosa]